jgi:hypothetical protein
VRIHHVIALALFTGLSGCLGDIGNSGGPGGNNPGQAVQGLCRSGPVDSGPTAIRRLTHDEFTNTVSDLFNGQVVSDDSFPRTDSLGGFSSFESANPVSASGVEAIRATVEKIAAQAEANAQSITGCLVRDEACFNGFLSTFLPRAFRRPVTDEERGIFSGLFRKASSFDEAVGLLVEAALQSPQFVYLDFRIDQKPGSVIPLSDYAVASRLSYFFWDTMPDATLFGKAERGELRTRAAILAEASRLMNDPRSSRAIRRFHRDWLHLYRLEGMQKDSGIYPEFNAELVGLMVEEVDRTVDLMFSNDDARLSTLLLGNRAVVNPALAALYEQNLSSDGWNTVDLPPGDRAGILSRSAFLTAHSFPGGSSPIRRGVFVLTQLLCQDLTPPPNAATDLPEPSGNVVTVRERLAAHSRDASCQGCHQRIDPIGLSFEYYDALGRLRDRYPDGQPVDAAVSLPPPFSGNVVGAEPFLEQIAESPDVRACYATQWFRFALGRRESDNDLCSLEIIHDRFARSDGDIRDLLMAIIESDAFLFRNIESDNAS